MSESCSSFVISPGAQRRYHEACQFFFLWLLQIGWELAPLNVIQAACGSSLHDVAPEVERVPLEEVVKNTDPKSVVFPNHWAKWC